MIGGAAAALGPTWPTIGRAFAATDGPHGPYGPLGPIDRNGLKLPAGFSSRVIATTGQRVPGTNYRWHANPDGGATFAMRGGGWVYVSNSEVGSDGGVGMVRFSASGDIVEARSILDGTDNNCAGGATPWGTWLSCEEVSDGRVWECDPTGARRGVVRPALGSFRHEAAAVDADRRHVYLTEDEGDGGLYRFVPDTWGDLSGGKLEVLTEADDVFEWVRVPDPSARRDPCRYQVSSMKVFDGGEGLAYHGGVVYLSTKGDNRVWAYHVETQTMSVLYEAPASNPILSGVDNLTVTCCGDVLVAEDGGEMQIVAILADGTLKPLVQVEGHAGSEITGPAFGPSGTRLYFSSQRSPGTNGLTFEVQGPFHLPV